MPTLLNRMFKQNRAPMRSEQQGTCRCCTLGNAPPDRIAQAILGQAKRKNCSSIRFVPVVDSMKVYYFIIGDTEGKWQEYMDIPEPLGSQVMAALWDLAQETKPTVRRFQIDLRD